MKFLLLGFHFSLRLCLSMSCPPNPELYFVLSRVTVARWQASSMNMLQQSPSACARFQSGVSATTFLSLAPTWQLVSQLFSRRLFHPTQAGPYVHTFKLPRDKTEMKAAHKLSLG